MNLGIDIGTTKTAVVIYDTIKKVPLNIISIPHNAGVILSNGHAEQSAEKHEIALLSAINQLPKELIGQVDSIGVTGQMHGVIMWNDSICSPLYTWQDQRDGVERLQKIDGCEGLRNGFGFSTLALVDTSNFTHAGTIMDYFVWKMTGEHLIDESNAASWGLFDLKKRDWDRSALARLGIRSEILPRIVKCGTIAGTLQKPESFGLLNSCKVYAAIGDNQASIIGCNGNNDTIYLSIGTSAQLSLIADSLVEQSKASFEIRPFINDHYLVVAPILCGGEVFKFLKDMVISWAAEFGVTLTDSQVFEKIDQLGQKELESSDLPEIVPTFMGERWDTESRAIIKRINLSNFSLGKISAAMAYGLAKHLKECVPDECLISKSIVVGNGNCLCRSITLQRAIEKTFGRPLQIQIGNEEAACGAAILSSLQ